MPLTAVVLLSIVSGALGFKSPHRSPGTVWCAATTVTVNPNSACNGQTGVSQIDYNTTGGTLTNPCAPKLAYDGSNGSTCPAIATNYAFFSSNGF